MFKGIEWIFFDVGSTLIDEQKAYEYVQFLVLIDPNCKR